MPYYTLFLSAADPGGSVEGGLVAQFVRALALRDRPAHRGRRAGDGAAVPALAVVPDQDRLAERNAADFFAQVRAAVGLVRARFGLVGRGKQPLEARLLLFFVCVGGLHVRLDRKSTRLNYRH